MLLLACAAPVQADGIRQLGLTEVTGLGRALYEHERRIAIASELLAENFDPRDAGVYSWVADGDGERLSVRFVHHTERGPRAAFEARFDELLLPTIEVPREAVLSPDELAQLAARDTVGPHLAVPCSDRYDSLVLPDPGGDGLLVYALAVAPEPDLIMLGGHYRFSVSADGTRLRQADALSTSCAAVRPTQLDGAVASDGNSGVGVRANLSDTPLEIHVLLSLRHGVPLYVMTRDGRLWRVDGDRLSIIKDAPGT